MKYLKKNDINSYTKFIKDYCHDRLLNKRDIKICFHPPSLKKVENDNYCDIHKDKKNL